MKLSGMYFLSPMETVYRLEERAQAPHDFATTPGDGPWPERYASDASAQHPILPSAKEKDGGTKGF
jgi:hypothetical protein